MNHQKSDFEEQHPDLAEIEALRTGESTDSTEAHVRSCSPCQRILDELSALSEDATANRPSIPTVPESADLAVRNIIARRSNEIRWRRSHARFVGRPAWAAAAAVVIVFLSIWMMSPHQREFLSTSTSSALSGDVDRSGEVDIVDAYLMAVGLEAGVRIPRNWDLNDDGSIDRQDIVVVTESAVAVVEEV